MKEKKQKEEEEEEDLTKHRSWVPTHKQVQNSNRVKSDGSHLKRMLFSCSDNSVFWVSGAKKDTINFYTQGKEGHEQYPLQDQTRLHRYWTYGNSQCANEINDSKQEKNLLSLPQAWPKMILFNDKKVIVFSYFQYGERPSTMFYSVGQGREIIQCLASNMLLHVSEHRDQHWT